MPDAFVQISSIMPQKRNPVPIEHLRHLASQTMARARAMLDVMHNTPFTDMNDSEGESQAMGYEAFASAARVLDLMTALVPALSVDRARVADNIRRSCATVTELADSLVRIEGLSFRQAHEIASQVARAVVARKGALEATALRLSRLPSKRSPAARRRSAPRSSRQSFRQSISLPSATGRAVRRRGRSPRRSPHYRSALAALAGAARPTRRASARRRIGLPRAFDC